MPERGTARRDAREELGEYRDKRRLERTPEPPAERGASPSGRSFVVQKHAARRLHYDLRLEHEGVLLSWAVPKGPSLDPRERRLAVRTEDHPVEYGAFEGVIPKGEYGAGTVLLWDRGTWTPLDDPSAGLEKGHLRFTLEGAKLRGRFSLIRTRGADPWLLIKGEDEEAQPGRGDALLEREARSVASGRTLDQISRDPD